MNNPSSRLLCNIWFDIWLQEGVLDSCLKIMRPYVYRNEKGPFLLVRLSLMWWFLPFPSFEQWVKVTDLLAWEVPTQKVLCNSFQLQLTFSSHLLYDKPSGRHFTSRASFNPHKNLKREDLSLPFIEEETKAHWMKRLSQGHIEVATLPLFPNHLSSATFSTSYYLTVNLSTLKNEIASKVLLWFRSLHSSTVV